MPGSTAGETIAFQQKYFVNAETRLADVAYMVADDFQGKGLGSELHRRTLEYAMAHGVRGFTADILEGNTAMLAVFERGPGHLRTNISHGIYELELLFDQSVYTERRFENLLDNLMLGALFVFIVVLFVMGWRSALLVGVALPLSALMVLAGMRAIGP